MMNECKKMTLREALRDALAGRLSDGWSYLPKTDKLTLETLCLMVDYDFVEDEQGKPRIAVEQGFPVEGLDTPTIERTVLCAKDYSDHPSDELLLESFLYYLRYDAWLPEPGYVPESLSWEEARRRHDREFYESLGPERSTVICQKPDCSRGAIELSVFCRVHHFQMVKGEPCPFDD